MKIATSSIMSFNRELPKPAPMRANTAVRAEPTKALDQSGQKVTPPGLERALAHLQSVPESERTAGQTNAMDRIGRNIARYTETESLSASPVELHGVLPQTPN